MQSQGFLQVEEESWRVTVREGEVRAKVRVM